MRWAFARGGARRSSRLRHLFLNLPVARRSYAPSMQRQVQCGDGDGYGEEGRLERAGVCVAAHDGGELVSQIWTKTVTGSCSERSAWLQISG